MVVVGSLRGESCWAPGSWFFGEQEWAVRWHQCGNKAWCPGPCGRAILPAGRCGSIPWSCPYYNTPIVIKWVP